MPSMFGHNGMLTFVRAVPSDLATIKAMLTRCGPQSRLRRFFGLLPTAPDGYREGVLTDRDNHFAVLIQRSGETIGLAELHLAGTWSGDLGLIVEDSFQQQGAGTIALQLLMRRARELGLRGLDADVHLENSHAIRVLRRMGVAAVRRAHDVLHIQLELEPIENWDSPNRMCASQPVHTVVDRQGERLSKDLAETLVTNRFDCRQRRPPRPQS